MLNDGANSATLTVATGSDTIGAAVILDSSVTMLPAAGSKLTVSGGISGAGGLTVNAPGTVVLTGANSYRGGTVVSAGRLVLTNSSAIPDGSSLTVGADATSLFGHSTGATNSIAAATTSNTSATNVASVAAIAASSNPVSLVQTAADLPAPVAVPTPSLVSVANVVVNSPVPTSTIVTTPPVALPLPASAPGPQRKILSKSVLAAVLGTSIAEQAVWASTAKRTAGDLAWLGQVANSSDILQQQRRKDMAILALDAVLAQYGQ